MDGASPRSLVVPLVNGARLWQDEGSVSSVTLEGEMVQLSRAQSPCKLYPSSS